MDIQTTGEDHMMHKGSCLCSAVHYEINGPLNNVLNCHCSMCRKHHGAAFRTRAAVKAVDFQFVKGEDIITFYESSKGEHRGFCSICGSNLLTKFDDYPDVYGFPLGTLDTKIDVKPTRHLFVQNKADWYDITDDVPQFDEM